MQCQVKGMSRELPWFSCVLYNLTSSAKDKEHLQHQGLQRQSAAQHTELSGSTDSGQAAAAARGCAASHDLVVTVLKVFCTALSQELG